MEFTHSVSQSIEYADRALTFLREHEIAPNPVNFFVWYAYVSSMSPELNTAIESLASRHQPVTNDLVARLYEQFCSPNAELTKLQPIIEVLERELSATATLLERAGAGSREYSDILAKTVQEITDIQTGLSDSLQRAVSRVLAKTRAMGLQTREVERQLLLSWSQVGKLSTELEETRREALTDSLTRLANRKMFDRSLRAAAIDALETGEPACLLMLDVDHFKAFNDEFGHVVGDQVLRLIGVILHDSIKGLDTAARYGGEEFAVILPKTNAKNGCLLANRIQESISGRKLINRQSGQRLPALTVSIGVALYNPTEPLSKWVADADRALYYAKTFGRNRVINYADVHDTVTDDASATMTQEPR